MLSCCAIAKPSYQQARSFYDQLKQPINDTSLFYKKSFQERVAYMNAAKALREKAEKMFGVHSACFSAASMRFEYVMALHDFVNRREGRITSQLEWMGITDPMSMAFVYGESTAFCYRDVEELDSRK